MLALLITLGSVAAYFAIGYVLALKDMPNLWVRARKSWSYDNTQRSAVQMGAAMTFLFWPFRWPFVWLFNAADQLDPKRLQEELAKREQEIAELERQLRIGGKP
jgi:hypothetical protein